MIIASKNRANGVTFRLGMVCLLIDVCKDKVLRHRCREISTELDEKPIKSSGENKQYI